MNTPRPLVRRRRRIHSLIVASAALILATCCPTVPPRAVVYTPPAPVAKRASATPAIEEARKAHAEADILAGKTADKVSNAKTGLDTLADRLLELVSQVGAFRAEPPLQGDSLNSVYNQLVEREKDARRLGVELLDVRQALELEKARRVMGADALAKSARLASDKEAETDELRGKLDDAVNANVKIQEQANTNADLARKAEARAEKLQGEVNTLRWLCLGVSVVAIGLLVLSVILRNARRTINPLS